MVDDQKERMGTTEAPSSSPSSSIGEESASSQGSSCSSSDLVDDASSSLTLSQDSPSSSSFACEGHRVGGGPLWELSDLMTHLPIKRGLSRHYAGKSQSFTSLASARSLEDLAKKENPCAKRLKLCTGRGGGFEGRLSPDIRGRGTLESMPRKRPSFLATSRPPQIPVVRTF
ncbi:hypothetical protein MLD38_015350 [Melastoma candidum]|uniref:Uncharacterized protein n=1 Tax=Melastoma candidum TaxID=119954 RepID=A0ACB9RFG2_9MYRT|nr:hypothetical protein MLD38_015350 [Melastoma candidum]